MNDFFFLSGHLTPNVCSNFTSTFITAAREEEAASQTGSNPNPNPNPNP